MDGYKESNLTGLTQHRLRSARAMPSLIIVYDVYTKKLYSLSSYVDGNKESNLTGLTQHRLRSARAMPSLIIVYDVDMKKQINS